MNRKNKHKHNKEKDQSHICLLGQMHLFDGCSCDNELKENKDIETVGFSRKVKSGSSLLNALDTAGLLMEADGDLDDLMETIEDIDPIELGLESSENKLTIEINSYNEYKSITIRSNLINKIELVRVDDDGNQDIETIDLAGIDLINSLTTGKAVKTINLKPFEGKMIFD